MIMRMRMFMAMIMAVFMVMDMVLHRRLLSSQIFYVGGGLNNHSFDGWMDEVRLVRECLPPEKFLHFRSGIGMSLMIK